MSWKSVNVNSTENVMTIAMIGVSSGYVMKRNRCHADVPSMVAASYSVGEIVCNPARSEIATKGMPRQTLAAMTAKRAFQLSPRKLIALWITPSLIGTHEMIENWLSYIHQKAIADRVVGTIHGSSSTARMNDLKAMFSLSSSASQSPR